MEGRLLLSTTSLGLWRLGSAQLLKPLLSPQPFLRFIISNQVNNSIKHVKKARKCSTLKDPGLGRGHEGRGPSAGSGGS